VLVTGILFLITKFILIVRQYRARERERERSLLLAIDLFSLYYTV